MGALSAAASFAGSGRGMKEENGLSHWHPGWTSGRRKR